MHLVPVHAEIGKLAVRELALFIHYCASLAAESRRVEQAALLYEFRLEERVPEATSCAGSTQDRSFCLKAGVPPHSNGKRLHHNRCQKVTPKRRSSTSRSVLGETFRVPFATKGGNSATQSGTGDFPGIWSCRGARRPEAPGMTLARPVSSRHEFISKSRKGA